MCEFIFSLGHNIWENGFWRRGKFKLWLCQSLATRYSSSLLHSLYHKSYTCQFNSVQFSCSVVSDSATPWTAARQASLSITNSWSLLKLMSIESVMPSNHLILCHPLLLPPSIFPTINLFQHIWNYSDYHFSSTYHVQGTWGISL